MKKLLLLLFVCTNTWATGIAGLNYTTYVAGGPTPGYTQYADGSINRTVASTGTVSTINFNWGSGGVLNSGRAEGVIVRFYGYVNIETAGTYWFGGNADDGIRIKVNNTSIVNSWQEDGGTFRSGSITLAAGVYPIELFYYENGGGAMVNLQWYPVGSSYWQIVPSTSLSTDSTYWVPPAPVLCCGGSSANFNASPSNVAKVQSFVTRTTNDSQVYIEQIGNNNTINIQQTGTQNNYAKYYSNGTSNNVTINQSGLLATDSNYIDLRVTGNTNTVNLTQQSTDGGKGAFVNISDNNNQVTVLQKDSGNDYLNLNLSGGYKTVDVTQSGSGNHMADITLTGAGARTLSLTQSGSTQQFYSINSNCTGSCQAITVTQP